MSPPLTLPTTDESILMTIKFENNLQYARELDARDTLKSCRTRFHFPEINGQPALYFVGNSLGLCPVTAREAMDAELRVWAEYGVKGHFREANPWYSYHELLSPLIAPLVGAQEHEVVCMNSLTVNLHLLFVSFYRPTRRRYKIISEAKMFPSDRYMLETQARHHGFEPDDAIIEVEPRPGESCIREEDILAKIEEHKDELAVVFFGAVNYFTGQFFDVVKLTEAAHEVGAIAGFDLAHAIGNLPLQLHDWQVDFAAWCSYKYLNAGPGNIAGIFVHEKHARDTELPRFGGWWGHDKERRFLMENHFQPMPAAEGWQLSNTPVFGMAVKKASLEIFNEIGIGRLREKSLMLTSWLEYIFNDVVAKFPDLQIKIITPEDPAKRGCQLSIKLTGTDRSLLEALTAKGALVDFREPDVIRAAPTPLYNSFEDVFQFGRILSSALRAR